MTTKLHSKTELLHKVVDLVVKENIHNQIFAAQGTLDFYLHIEDKTDEDLAKISRLEAGIASLSSPEFEKEASNILAEEYSRMPEKYLQILHDSIMLEMHMSEIAVTLAPRMTKLQEDVLYGTAPKKVVH